MVMVVRTLVSKLVQPSVSPPFPYDRVIRSSNLDLVATNTYIKTVYFYRRPNVQQRSDFFSADVLAQSLSQALSHYYPMAGRLTRGGERSIEISCNGAGALFVTACADCTMEELEGFEPKPEFLQLVPTLESFPEESLRPLFIVQVTTFECGGVCLGIGVEHHVADGISAVGFLNEWSGIARGKPLESQPCFDRIWLKARTPPTPLYAHDEYLSLPERGSTNSHIIGRGASDDTVRIFEISKEFLQGMKQRCSSCDSTPFSTYELLAAHVWRCVCKARQLSSAEETKLTMPVDGRSRLTSQPRLRDQYFGNVIFTSCSTGTVAQVTASLAQTARNIRQNLRRMDDAYCRSAIDFLELQPDLSRFVKGPHTFVTPHLGLVSWTKLPMYDCDFGWGKPMHVGPASLPGEGLALLMSSPLLNDGSLRLCISLLSHHMQAFSELILQLQEV